MSDKNIFKGSVDCVFTVDHASGNNAEGNGGFFIGDQGVKMKSALGHDFRVIGEFRKSLQGNLRPSSDPVLGMQVEIRVHHKLIKVRQVVRRKAFPVKLLQ
jgi:hypothetical protein